MVFILEHKLCEGFPDSLGPSSSLSYATFKCMNITPQFWSRNGNDYSTPLLQSFWNAETNVSSVNQSTKITGPSPDSWVFFLSHSSCFSCWNKFIIVVVYELSCESPQVLSKCKIKVWRCNQLNFGLFLLSENLPSHKHKKPGRVSATKHIVGK